MKYLHFCIFLSIWSTFISVNTNEEIQSLHLLDNTNYTMKNEVPKYTTYCYSVSNCTNFFTFYSNSNSNSVAIIEVQTELSNYTISLNTSYTVNDSNVELMLTPVYLYFHQYIGFMVIKVFVINLTSETSLMNDWDTIDHVYRRCDAFLGGIPALSDLECERNLQCLAYRQCLRSNVYKLMLVLTLYKYNQIRDIYSFFMTYIIIVPYVIGLLFSVLNIAIFIQLSSLKNPFMMFVTIQSFYCIFWFLSFFLFTASYLGYGKSLLGLQPINYLPLIGSTKSTFVFVYTVFVYLVYLCGFGIETIRFFKALSRVFALRFPLWFSGKLKIKHALFSCLSTFMIGIIAWVLVILTQTETSADGFSRPVISMCGNDGPLNTYYNKFLYIVFGWDCFPQYILFDELFPLTLITLLLDCYVFFLLKRSKLNDQQKKLENVLKLFIVVDLIDTSYSCIRRMFLFVNYHAMFLGYLSNLSSQWSIFYYNSFARYIILTFWFIDKYFFYVIKIIFYAVEMVVCQILMRRIQIIENPHDVPRTFVDKFLLKLTKKFYTRVLRVQPTTQINNSTNIVVAHS